MIKFLCRIVIAAEDEHYAALEIPQRPCHAILKHYFRRPDFGTNSLPSHAPVRYQSQYCLDDLRLSREEFLPEIPLEQPLTVVVLHMRFGERCIGAHPGIKKTKTDETAGRAFHPNTKGLQTPRRTTPKEQRF